MKYETFKEVVARELKDYLSPELQGMIVEIFPVEKLNAASLDGIRLTDNSISSEENVCKAVKVVPNIYVNDMYKNYLKCNDLAEVLRLAAYDLENAIKQSSEVAAMIDFTTAKDNIIFQFVNTEQNKELLVDIPNRQFYDLSIVYRWMVKSNMSAIIHNDLAERLGFNEEQLFRLAKENTRRMYPPVVKCEIFMQDGMPPGIADMMVGEMPLEQTMWVITNNSKSYGAISMLYKDQLQMLAEKLGTDLYILPSSIHEVIAVSTSMGDPNDLARIVEEINFTEVDLEERLSNQVYYYDKELRALCLATDTTIRN